MLVAWANFPAAAANRSLRTSARAPFIARCVASASGLQIVSKRLTYSSRVGASAAAAAAAHTVPIRTAIANALSTPRSPLWHQQVAARQDAVEARRHPPDAVAEQQHQRRQ